MSEITRGAIGMPFEMAMISELSRRQFHSIAQALLAERDQLFGETERLKSENEALRKLYGDIGIELRKASSWICREVEAGTQSATHWAIRLREKADQIDGAMGKGGRS